MNVKILRLLPAVLLLFTLLLIPVFPASAGEKTVPGGDDTVAVISLSTGRNIGYNYNYEGTQNSFSIEYIAGGGKQDMEIPILMDTVLEGEQALGALPELTLKNGKSLMLLSPLIFSVPRDIEEVTSMRLRLHYAGKIPDSPYTLSLHAVNADWREDAVMESSGYGDMPFALLKAPRYKAERFDFREVSGKRSIGDAFEFTVNPDGKPYADIDIPEEIFQYWMARRIYSGLALKLKSGAESVSFVSRAPVKNWEYWIGGRSDTQFLLPLDTASLRMITAAPEDILDGEVVLKMQYRPPADGKTPQRLECFAVSGIPRGLMRLQEKMAEKPFFTMDLPVQPTADGLIKIRIKDVAPVLRELLAAGDKGEASGGILVRLAESKEPALLFSQAFSERTRIMNIKLRQSGRKSLAQAGQKVRSGVFTENRNGKLFYGGERLRLWGVEINNDTPENALPRIKRLGFNSVRLAYPGTRDRKELDKFERLFAAAERHGFFITLALPLLTEPDLTPDDAEDFALWESSIGRVNAGFYELLSGMDERLKRQKNRQLEAFASRVNPYTGRRCTESENVVMFELGSDYMAFYHLLNSGYGVAGEYFSGKIKLAWNAWLRRRYRNTAGLHAAWEESFNPEENMLENNSIPLLPHARNYSIFNQTRGNDITNFFMESELLRFKNIENILKKAAGSRPVLVMYDTQSIPCIPYTFINAQADAVAVGGDFWGLVSALRIPPAMRMLDGGTVGNRMTFVRNVSAPRPNPYRAEFPFRLLAIAALQDYDAVYFGEWMPGMQQPGMDEEYLLLPLDYPTRNDYTGRAAGRGIGNDPALLASCSLAGQVFLSGRLVEKRTPARHRIGHFGILGFKLWNGPAADPDFFINGRQLDFAPSEKTVESMVRRSDTAQTGTFKSGKFITYDWPNGRLIFDMPSFKAYVGVPHGDYRFSDLISVGNLEEAGNFAVAALYAPDGSALADKASNVIALAVADSKNSGFSMNTNNLSLGGIVLNHNVVARRILKNGTLPIENTRVPVRFYFPNELSGEAEGLDFLLCSRGVNPLSGNIWENSAAENFVSLLRIASRSGKCETPAGREINDEIEFAEARGGISPLDGMFMPMRGVSWSDSLNSLRYKLRATGREPRLLPMAGNMYALRISDIPVFFSRTADIDFVFRRGAMVRLFIAFKTPPELDRIINIRTFGKMVTKDIPERPTRPTMISWRQMKNGKKLDITYWQYQDSAVMIFE